MFFTGLMKSLYLGIGLDGLLEEVKSQGTMALYVVFIVAGIFLFVKRAWGLLVTLIFGGGLLIFFVQKPDVLKNVGTWISGLLGL